jgi:hypothetical protein
MAVNIKNLTNSKEETTEEALDRLSNTYKLSDHMKRFVYEYTKNGGNRTTALLDAGYLASRRKMIEDREDKSDEAKKARAQLSITGSQLMKHKKVQRALEEFGEIYKASIRGDIERDVYRIARLRATYDIRDMIETVIGNNPDEIVEKVKELPEDVALCIDSISFKYWGKDANQFSVDIKFADRQKNIEFLSKLAGFMIDRKEVKNTGTMPAINIAVMAGNTEIEEKKAK